MIDSAFPQRCNSPSIHSGESDISIILDFIEDNRLVYLYYGK